jgi:hypothetical protein
MFAISSSSSPVRGLVPLHHRGRLDP